MKVQFTHGFIKVFKKRFSHRPNFQKRFDERLKKFAENTQDPVLEDHALSGKLQGYKAFSITGDIRVVYYIHEDTAYFVDVGTHNQVYGR